MKKLKLFAGYYTDLISELAEWQKRENPVIMSTDIKLQDTRCVILVTYREPGAAEELKP